jgi:hypothetical protein
MEEEQPKITPEEYGKRVAQSIELNISRREEWEKMIRSRDSVLSLEEDVDTPMKKIMVMLALLEVKTYFSCCGFNYNGQPVHKVWSLASANDGRFEVHRNYKISSKYYERFGIPPVY